MKNYSKFLLLSILGLTLLLTGCTTTLNGECRHKFMDATYTAPRTCKRCGETEGDALENAFFRHGVGVKEGDEEIATSLLLVSRENEENTLEVPAVFSVLCTEKELLENGRVVVVVEGELNATTHGLDEEADVLWRYALYDLYSGRRIQLGSEPNIFDYGYREETILAAGTSDYSYGEWYIEGLDVLQDITCHVTFRFECDEDYDGFVLAMIPTLSREDAENATSFTDEGIDFYHIAIE